VFYSEEYRLLTFKHWDSHISKEELASSGFIKYNETEVFCVFCKLTTEINDEDVDDFHHRENPDCLMPFRLNSENIPIGHTVPEYLHNYSLPNNRNNPVYTFLASENAREKTFETFSKKELIPSLVESGYFHINGLLDMSRCYWCAVTIFNLTECDFKKFHLPNCLFGLSLQEDTFQGNYKCQICLCKSDRNIVLNCFHVISLKCYINLLSFNRITVKLVT